MSRAAFSAKVFAVYVFIVGAALAIAPNILLPLFRIPETSEVWIRVAGVLAFNIGLYVWVSAGHKPFLQASVYTRCIFFLAVTAFALLGLATPAIILFGAIDLLGGLWTHFALKADSRPLQPVLAGHP